MKRIVELRGGFAPAPVPPGWELNQLPAGLPLVQTVEPEQGPWTRAGAFGRLDKFAIPDSAGIIKAIFSNDHIEGPPRARVINLFRSDLEVTHGANSGFLARVTYGVGGVQNQFFCDWLSGGQFALVATTLRIEAISCAPAVGAYAAEAGSIVLGAVVGAFGDVSAGCSPLTFTPQQVELAHGESATVALPDFARRVIPQVILNGNAYSDCELAALGGGGRLGEWQGTEFTAEVARQGVTLPGGTNRVFFENNGTHIVQLALQFQLGL